MDFRLPELGEGVYEAELINWLVKPGDRVKRGQALMEVMTDKATMEVPSPFVGTVSSLKAEPGKQIKIGDVVLAYEGAEASSAESRPGEPSRSTAAAAAKTERQVVQSGASSPGRDNGPAASAMREPVFVKAAPSVRFLARKLGIDLQQIQGTGPGGRILIQDLSERLTVPAGKAERARPAAPKPDYGKPGTRIKLQGLRRKIAEHMVQSKRTIPHYAYVDECDVTELVRLRESLKETYAQAGIKLTYLAFIVKATALALVELPIVNSSVNEEAAEIVLHDRYDIGVAVATPGGLIVPVVRAADKKSVGEIAKEIERLGADARAGKTRLEDLRGSTFTVTSIGGIGGLISTPVINSPEVGILGVGKVVRRPVYDQAGNLRPADLLYLSFSFDHRVLDGAIGAEFGNTILRRLQNPASLLLPAKLG